MKSIGSIGKADEHSMASSKREEKFHTRLFNARGISGDTITEPRSRMRRAIKAGPALAFSAVFDNVGPLKATNLFALLKGKRGTKDGTTENASISMCVKLSIKGSIPVIPVVKLLKVAAGETPELTFSIGHTIGTESVK